MSKSFSKNIHTPVPENEKERLESLKSYGVLDTQPEEDFDAITRLAARISDSPIAYISLIDEDRQWFKSKIGIEVQETPREISICQHAIMQDELYEIPNLLENNLFANNPLVTGKPKIRFYAGAPLIDSEGFRLGTLCVIDTKPKKLTEEQKDVMALLAKTVVTHLKLRKDKRELEESKKVLQRFFDLSLDFMCIANVNGYFLKVSATFSTVLGYTEQELLGRPFFDFIHPDDLEKTLEEVKKLSQGELTIQFENRFCKTDGSYIWLSWNANPDTTTGHLYASARDITQHKLSEELFKKNLLLEKEKEIAEKSIKLKEEFLANMSHEMRTPLNSVIGLSNLLLKTTNPEGKQLEYLRNIHLNSKNLFGLVNNILDFAKIESGNYKLEKIDFNLKEIVMDTVRSIQLSASEKGLKLNTDIDQNIPTCVNGDPARLIQTLINLVSNSIKFTDKGGVKLSLELITLNTHSALVKFTIADTGSGIPADMIDEIFYPFKQANNSLTRAVGGTGLGLTITKKLIELMGGEIKVLSEEGIGSQFFFTLMFPVPELTVNDMVTQNNIDEITASDGLKILLVEDNAFNQIVAVDTLKEWNSSLTVDVAENGIVAIEKLKHTSYDVILMDIQMPEMDGHAAAKKIRNELPPPICKTPIIAMTAHASVSEIESCFHEGMNDYITKPFDPKDLFSKIMKVIKSEQVQNS